MVNISAVAEFIAVTFKTALFDQYHRITGQKLDKVYPMTRCMLLDRALPICLVTAGHIFKHAWRDLVMQWMGFADIDDVRNGMLLFKPLEYYFDHGHFIFVASEASGPSGSSGRKISHKLKIIDPNPAFRNMSLVQALASLPSNEKLEGFTCAEWAEYPPLVSLLKHRNGQDMTIGDLEGNELCSHHWRAWSGNLANRPYTRCLWFHARMCVVRGRVERKWDVEDELVGEIHSDDYVDPRERVVKWLEQL
jgi:HNH endonuclease